MRSVRWMVWALLLGLASAAAMAGDVTVSFIGHSCFTIQAEGGPVILIDPYASYVPYPGLPVPADIVLMTHAHVDHCPYCFGENDRVLGEPAIVRLWDANGRCREKLPPGAWVITPEFKLHAIEATHVTLGGGGEGWVCMFRFEVGGIQFAHLGDLGRTLTDAQVAALSGVDVLFIPVGGAFTVSASEAMNVIAQLPLVKVVFPMHYFVAGVTPSSWSAMKPLSAFTLLARAMYSVREIDDYQARLNAETLPRSTEVWILDHKTD